MNEDFVLINELPTKIVTIGRWITDVPPKSEEKIILIITGNPGITAFYKTFIKVLHEKNQCPVWVIGHTGHEKHSRKKLKLPHPKPVGLREQIEQKVTFIEKYVPEGTKLHVMGHSIGSYMTLELLKEPTIENKIYQVYLLFPVIDRMADAPNGKKMLNQVRPVKTTLVFSSRLFRLLPKIISMNSLKVFMSSKKLPSKDREAMYGLVQPKVLNQVFFLVYQQLEQVTDRDDENIRKNVHRINIIYGERDGWCIPESCEEMKTDFPQINAIMTKINHGFFFRENEEVADIVTDWVQEKVSSQL